MPEYHQTDILDEWNRYVLFSVIVSLFIFFSARYVYGSNGHDIEVNIQEATEQFPPGSIAAQMFAQV